MEPTGRSHGDPYQVLGLGAGASRRDIVRAYRQAAQRAHPDTQPHDPGAAARFQALTDAYELLTDPGRRAEYDRGHRASGPAGPQPPAPGPVRRRGPGYWPAPPGPRHIWAGPVLIEPPATGPLPAEPAAAGEAGTGRADDGQADDGQAAADPAAGQHGRGAAADPAAGQHGRGPAATEWVDPPVVLGLPADGVWGRGW